MTLIIRWILVLTLFGLWSACAAQVPRDQRSDWGPLAVTLDDDPSEFLEGGGGAGRLTVSDNCVFRADEDGFEWTMAWRSGQTSWDPEAQVIVFRDPALGEVFLRDGDQVEVFGAPLVRRGYEPEWVVEPDEGCPENILEAHTVRQLGE